MSAQKGEGHGGEHRTNDNLLQLIAEKERELETQTEAARTEATAIVAQARAEVEQILREAREQAAVLARESEQRVAAEVARIDREAALRAAQEVETLRAQVTGRMDAAVKLVVDQVVKGTGA